MKIVNIFHADHGVSESTLAWALDTIKPTGFFAKTLTLPEGHADLQNKLWGPACGDESMAGESYMRVRNADDKFRQETPFVKRGTRPTRLVTVIGMADAEKGEVVIFTTYGGPLALQIPSDPHLPKGGAEEAASIEFWTHNALADI